MGGIMLQLYYIYKQWVYAYNGLFNIMIPTFSSTLYEVALTC